MTVHERIKVIRIEKGMSQIELANKIGYTSKGAISRIENGQRRLKEETIMLIANALGVSPAYLLTGEESQENYKKPAVTELQQTLINRITSMDEEQIKKFTRLLDTFEQIQ
jgi:transcriptional regulator with XRE-family HTH domain